MFRKKRPLQRYRNSFAKTPSLRSRWNNRKTTTKTSRVLLKKGKPFFSKIKKFTIIIGSLIGIILFSHMIFFSSYFLVTDIKINNKEFQNENLTSSIKKNTKNALGKNLIFIDLEEINSKLLDKFPELEGIEISKNYPDMIEITFQEFPLSANLIAESKSIKKSYIINSIGYAVKENLENTALPYIKIKSDEPINTKIPVIEAAKLKYILDTITYFEDKFGMRIVEVEYKKIPREIHLLTEKSFYIWLDIQYSAEEQLKKLKKALVKLDIFTESLSYIDLRIAGASGDKIIYKRK